jgi:hypothetical protein
LIRSLIFHNNAGGEKMMKFYGFVLVCVLAAGSNLLPSLISPDTSVDAGRSTSAPTNGAFRDGLYLGKLATQRGDEFHISKGRWSTEEDRTSFAEGYRLGFRQSQFARAN